MPVKYLRPNVVFEPLVDRWYAWSHLISPATSAMNTANRHMKIMDSYIQAPAIHASAVKNPKMRGGPFMDLKVDSAGEVKKLRDRTMEVNADQLELSRAITELANMVQAEAKGFSMEALYNKIPLALKGYVELVYDINSQPSFRLFESLLYHSKYYKPELQSLCLWVADNDERPFVLSTPRLDSNGALHLPLTFADPLIDRLAIMRRSPDDTDEIKAALEKRLERSFSDDESRLFDTLFTDEVPTRYEKYTGDHVRIRYLGHACILFETKDISILVDPLVSYYGYQSEVDRFSDMDLPDHIDYVLITHNHQDHILFETLLAIRHRVKKLIVPRGGNRSLQDPSLKLMFEHIGFKNVHEIDEMQPLRYEDCMITGVPFLGEHSDLDIMSKVCYHVRCGEFSVMFAADSCIVDSTLYEHVHKLLGDVDVIFLGMECDGAPLSWLYGPLLPKPLERDKDNSRRLAGSNFERGRSLVEIFSPAEVYVYAMGQEPWVEFISSIKYTAESNPIVQSDKLMEYSKSHNIIGERLFGEKEILFSKTRSKVPV